MTVNASPATISYDGAGSPGPFAIPFYFLQDTHIFATKDGSLLSLNIDYTLDGAGDMSGGSLLLDTDLIVGETLLINLVVPIDQQSTFPRNGPFPAATVEHALDKLTMICKMLRDLLAVLRADMDGFEAQITALESDVSVLSDAVDALTANLTAINNHLTSLDVAVAQLDAEIGAIPDCLPLIGGVMEANGSTGGGIAVTPDTDGNLTIEPEEDGQIRLNAPVTQRIPILEVTDDSVIVTRANAASAIVKCTNSNPTVAAIQTDGGFLEGDYFSVLRQFGAGQVTVQMTGAGTIYHRSIFVLETADENCMINFVCLGGNEWVASGDLGLA